MGSKVKVSSSGWWTGKPDSGSTSAPCPDLSDHFSGHPFPHLLHPTRAFLKIVVAIH